jgi:hypothetical protein
MDETLMRKLLHILFSILLANVPLHAQIVQQTIIHYPGTVVSCSGAPPWSLTANVDSTGGSSFVITIAITACQTVVVVGGPSNTGALDAGETITGVSANGGACGTPFAQIAVQVQSIKTSTSIWAASNCPVSTNVTVTTNVSSGDIFRAHAYAISGLPLVLTTDGTNTAGNTSASNPQAGPAVTPTKAGDFIASTFNCYNGTSGQTNAAWSSASFVYDQGYAYLTSNSAASGSPYNPSWTPSIGACAFYSAATAAFATH